MRYFHRSTVSPDTVLSEAERFFSSFEGSWTGPRGLKFTGSIGQIKVGVAMEGDSSTAIAAGYERIYTAARDVADELEQVAAAAEGRGSTAAG